MRANTARIAAKLEQVCGLRIGTPAYTWAAPFGNTTDGLPIIDAVPGMKRVYSVMGFGGNGITYAMIAAQIIAANIAGKPDADADLFVFRQIGAVEARLGEQFHPMPEAALKHVQSSKILSHPPASPRGGNHAGPALRRGVMIRPCVNPATIR